MFLGLDELKEIKTVPPTKIRRVCSSLWFLYEASSPTMSKRSRSTRPQVRPRWDTPLR